MAVPTFEPTRAKWWGVRASAPSGLTEADQGAWWYRSDLDIFCYWTGTEVLCWGGMGGALFSGDQQIICAAGGDYAVTVTISSPWAPGTINNLIDIHFVDVSPVVDPGTPVNPTINGNVVGFTLVGVGAGCTITSRVKVTGW